MIKIHFLYWEGCPSYEKALNRLKELLNELEIEHSIQIVKVETEEEVKKWAFPGSPTIRLDGEDIDPKGAKDIRQGLTCRIYKTPDGKILPLPTKDMIKSAILKKGGKDDYKD